MGRIGLAMLLLLPLCAGADALGQPRAPDESPQPQQPQDPELAPQASLVLGELDSRLTVPVAIGDSGPYRFVIDTGAERSVISRELASELQLGPGKPVKLTTMTERSNAQTVIVRDLSIQSIGDRHTLEAPALARENVGAAGLLGLDTLAAHLVTIDFENSTMEVRRARPRTAGARDYNEIVVRAKSMFGQLIVTDAYLGNTRIRVVIDTGSVVSMGNSALRRAAGRQAAKSVPIVLTSVTGGTTTADYASMSDVRIGGVAFSGLPVAFADVAPFKHFGLDDKPALLLGMDALRAFRKVEVDFLNRQIRFLMPRIKYRNMRQTGTMLPGVRTPSATQTY